MSEDKNTPTPQSQVRGAEAALRKALLTTSALRGYKGFDMGRVAGYRLAAEIAEEGLENADRASKGPANG